MLLITTHLPACLPKSELGLTAEDSDYVPSEPFNRIVGNSSGNRRSGSRGRKKFLDLNSTAVVGSFNEGSFASSLSFSESVTDEDNKFGGGGGGGSGGSAGRGGVSGVRMIKYSPPVDKAVDAMDNASFSCVSTSEGGVSEDGGGGGVNPTASFSDEITPERPPRKPRAGTRSNSDTDGGKKDATIKPKRDAGGGAGVGLITSEFYAGSEPDSRKKEIVKSTATERSRRHSGAGSPRKKTGASSAAANGVKISPVSKEARDGVAQNSTTTTTPPAAPSSKVRGVSRSSPQHWSSSGRARAETQSSAAAVAAGGGGTGSAAPSLQLGDTSGDEAEDIDDGHDRPESFCELLSWILGVYGSIHDSICPKLLGRSSKLTSFMVVNL